MSPPLPRLSAAQAAHRLGITSATLYAYVSRGLLSRERTSTGSTFDPLEIEAFAGRRSRRSGARPDPSAQAGTPLMVLDTDVAVVLDDELFFRGRSATRLAEASDLESVAAWLWEVEPDAPRTPLHSDVPALRRVIAALPPQATLLDRLQAAVTTLAASDPLRGDTSADGLRRVGMRLLTHLPHALSTRTDAAAGDVSETLWTALSTRAADADDLRVLRTALVLGIDHDLAVSTLAARVAASARASGYAIVSAALGAFDSPLHGTAGLGAVDLLARVIEGDDTDVALATVVRDRGGGVPGFGQPLYSGTDARAAALRPMIERMRKSDPVIAAWDAVADTVWRRTGARPNIDLAIAALVLAGGFRRDAGPVVFAIARIVGWIAHALREYEERPLRLRPRGRYVGPQP